MSEELVWQTPPSCACGDEVDIFFLDTPGGTSPPCCFVCFCLEIMEW